MDMERQQNQGKSPVLEPKTSKSKCILLKNSSLDFFQTYTSRRVAYWCIFLYMKSQLCRPTTVCHSSIPPQPISSWLQNSHEIKILNHLSKFSVASKTNVVSIMIAGHGPLWQVFRLKAPSARTQKVILNEILYYIRESWYETFGKYDSQSPAGFENLRSITNL